MEAILFFHHVATFRVWVGVEVGGCFKITQKRTNNGCMSGMATQTTIVTLPRENINLPTCDPTRVNETL